MIANHSNGICATLKGLDEITKDEFKGKAGGGGRVFNPERKGPLAGLGWEDKFWTDEPSNGTKHDIQMANMGDSKLHGSTLVSILLFNKF